MISLPFCKYDYSNDYSEFSFFFLEAMARYGRKKTKTIPPPRKYPSLAKTVWNRPAKRKQWTREQMEAAMKAATSGTASINRAAVDHGVLRTTLKDRLSGCVVDGTKPGPLPYLTGEEESELEKYLTESSQIGYGRTRRQVKSIVESIAQDKGVLRSSHVSDGWWRRFLERHPFLSLRRGDATGHVRMNAMTQENLKSYFDLLEEVLDENDLKNHPERIYNMDETGVPLDPKPPKVIAPKGQRKVRYRCSGSKSQITVLGCCNGTGQAVPPFIIFDAKQLNHLWTHGEVPGTRYGLSDSGWTDRGLFHGWLKEHFLLHAVSGRPLLLLVDGHSSHFDLESIQYAKEQSVIIFCLPPHTTHEAQPLDVSFFGPLKNHWSDVCHTFLQSSPGKVITKFNFSQFFSKAWSKTCNPETICSGFRRAGIIPFDPMALFIRCPKNSGVEEMTSNGEESMTNSADTPGVTFSSEKEELFSTRFVEGYDLHDEEYELWLHVNHPEVTGAQSVVDFFSDVDPVTQLNPPCRLSPVPEVPPDISPVLSDGAHHNSPVLPDGAHHNSPVLPDGAHHNSPVLPDGAHHNSPVLPDGAHYNSPVLPDGAHHNSPVLPDGAHYNSPVLPDGAHHNSPVLPDGAHHSASCTSGSTSSPLASDTSSSNSSQPLFPSPAASVPETPPSNSVSPLPGSTPCRKRSPLAPIVHQSWSSSSPQSPVSPLNKYLLPVVSSQPKIKSGRARVLTSAECMQTLEDKKKQKEKEAQEKEARKRKGNGRGARLRGSVFSSRKKKRDSGVRRKLLSRRRTLFGDPRGRPSKGKTARKTRSTTSCGPSSSADYEGPSTSGGPSTFVDFGGPSTSADSGPSTSAGHSTSQCDPNPGDQESCDCAFCYESYCSDGQEPLDYVCLWPMGP